MQAVDIFSSNPDDTPVGRPQTRRIEVKLSYKARGGRDLSEGSVALHCHA